MALKNFESFLASGVISDLIQYFFEMLVIYIIQSFSFSLSRFLVYSALNTFQKYIVFYFSSKKIT